MLEAVDSEYNGSYLMGFAVTTDAFAWTWWDKQ